VNGSVKLGELDGGEDWLQLEQTATNKGITQPAKPVTFFFI
jgi:hypothetical protein